MLKQSPELQYTYILASINEQIFRDARRTFNGRHYCKQLNDVLSFITWFYHVIKALSSRAEAPAGFLSSFEYTHISSLCNFFKEDNDAVEFLEL